MRRALFAAALLAATPAYAAGKLPAPAAKNESVALALDEVHTLTFRAPVATVYVGNPTIADVTMIDARHAFVQGKGYGRTNIVALNRDNVQVFNTHITVTGNDARRHRHPQSRRPARDLELCRRPLRTHADAGRRPEGLRGRRRPGRRASECRPRPRGGGSKNQLPTNLAET